MKTVNKHGQSIGRKGIESRRRLLDATRALLKDEASYRLTAAAIARSAGLASQTFYLYFSDIDELLLILSEEASADTAEILAALTETPASVPPAVYSARFIEVFSAYWDRHRAILSIRNYQSDNGHAGFLKARQDSAVPLVQAMANRMVAANPQGKLGEADAFARSMIIYAAIERMAARYTRPGQQEGSINADLLKRAEADILTLLLTPST